MAKSTATETKLGALHGKVADVLSARLDHQAEDTTFDENGVEVGTGEMVYDCSTQDIAAAIKFLKDNQITADIETDSQMGNLKEKLAKKTKHSRLASVSPIETAKEMG